MSTQCLRDARGFATGNASAGAAKRATATSGASELINDGVVATSSVLLIGSFFWVPAYLYYVWRNKCKTRRRKALFLACLVAFLAGPMPVTRRIARLSVWNRFWRYFSGSFVGEMDACRGKQSLFCLVPHGVFPFGVALASLGRANETVFNAAKPVCASIMLRTPIIGNILRMIGAVGASRDTMDDALKQGHSLSLAPGGIGEMFLDGEAGKEFALLRGHKGFVRRAMAHGVPLVPVYVFGNSQTFKRVPLPAALESLSRLLKASLVLFWGRWGLPIPFKVPLTFAFGETLDIEKNLSPSDEQVDAVHARFCEALADVFDRYKGTYGWGDTKLELR
ncbi:mono-or diacylglycerol acyltransferase type 2 [Ectocarpus siliculosus]|uniref:Acyltransferase n=1 Tax=Ectocarpus siliculosus TaxID=2880 RepID=D8LSD5_ECTSI|nr:mono-or diacylglycerol acyltransferase type 2 [Ectocarpus siliculosus]|eukprot:CBN75192.1 mono-or diacylglycerol acyltransferase type 2 [Ectocarpus siliculosus]